MVILKGNKKYKLKHRKDYLKQIILRKTSKEYSLVVKNKSDVLEFKETTVLLFYSDDHSNYLPTLVFSPYFAQIMDYENYTFFGSHF